MLLSFLFIWRKFIELAANIYIPNSVDIGSGLYIAHFGPIIIHPDVIIGNNCTLTQGVTLGKKHDGKNAGTPTIGNRVYCGPNSVIIGNIVIGDDVIIGPNTLISRDIPPKSVVVGNPAKIISDRGSHNLIKYS
jgi:serine O-acetyltransferase